MSDTIILYVRDFADIESMLDVVEGLQQRGISVEIKGKY